ncbi:MAG: hypothetical protein EOO46_13395 [Flavobacterium sp.]|nr:MAG: hypothetical protein EOO46_13395 [Flavobacterium sp.]
MAILINSMNCTTKTRVEIKGKWKEQTFDKTIFYNFYQVDDNKYKWDTYGANKKFLNSGFYKINKDTIWILYQFGNHYDSSKLVVKSFSSSEIIVDEYQPVSDLLSKVKKYEYMHTKKLTPASDFDVPINSKTENTNYPVEAKADTSSGKKFLSLNEEAINTSEEKYFYFKFTVKYTAMSGYNEYDEFYKEGVTQIVSIEKMTEETEYRYKDIIRRKRIRVDAPFARDVKITDIKMKVFNNYVNASKSRENEEFEYEVDLN